MIFLSLFYISLAFFIQGSRSENFLLATVFVFFLLMILKDLRGFWKRVWNGFLASVSHAIQMDWILVDKL
jgi:hypothetical protein